MSRYYKHCKICELHTQHNDDGVCLDCLDFRNNHPEEWMNKYIEKEQQRVFNNIIINQTAKT